MKTRNLFFAIVTLSISIFFSFISPENPQDKSTLNFSDFKSANNRVSRAQLSVYKQVGAGFGEDFAFNGLKLKVQSYTFVMVKKKGDSFFENVKGNKLTSTIKAQLLQAKPGDMIILSQVAVTGDGWTFNRIIDGPALTIY